MPSRLDDTTVPLVVCEQCRKRLPKDEAHRLEASDDEIYFCGTGCLAQWRVRSGANGAPKA